MKIRSRYAPFDTIYESHGDSKRVDVMVALNEGVSLVGADLSRLDLHDLELMGKDLCEVDFEGANLRNTDLREADLSRATLTGADLTNTVLSGVKLDGAEIDHRLTWEQYLSDLVPALLTVSGVPLHEFRAAGAWSCHTWTNCPMAIAFGVHDLKDIPPLYRSEARRFIQFFDAVLIPDSVLG